MRARLHGGRAAGEHPVFFGGTRRHGSAHRLSGLPGGALTLGVGLVLAVAAIVVAASAIAGHNGGVGSLLSSTSPNTPAAPAKPLGHTRIISMPHASVGNGTERLTVTLSGQPAPGSVHPTLSPSGYGSWARSSDAWVFKASSTLTPCSSYRLTVPAATTAIDDTALGHRRSVSLKVACPSMRALQQALARLAYLPDSLHAARGAKVSHGAIGARRAAHLLYEPVAGRLRSDVAYAPPLAYGQLDSTTKGALMVFQEDHKLESDGEPGPATWQKLLAAVANDYRNPRPYTFVTVTESLPETLEVHKGNRVVLSTPANTGVPGAETEQGTFPIYARYTSTTMVGTDPDGTKYDVPDVPWVNYFNGGDAVHGYERAGYGYPQSNGCVELPISTAQTVFGMLRLGDIVVVS
jgi:peptidoglycan hydrolase-like protein with peptidoglycan-binding domain